MTTNVLFGTLIKELRISKNLKLIDLATQLGMDKGLLSKIENNERRATKDQLEKFIKSLDANPKKLQTCWLASRIIYELEDEDYGLEALMVAEQIVKYHALKKESLDDLTEEILVLKNKLDGFRPIPVLQLENLINAYKIDYTYESNRIEGNTLTLQETALVVEKGLTINGKSMREHLEAINHAEAIDYITDLVKNKIPFNERTLLELHSLVLRGIDKENIKRGQVICKPGSITPHTVFKCEIYVLSKEEGGRHTPFFNKYRPQFYLRTTDVTGEITLPEGREMVMPGDNLT